MEDKTNDILNVRNMAIFQFDMAWELLTYNLNGLDDKMCLWRPGEKGLHVSKNNGVWHADWPDYEGFEIGASSIAWITWHITFWWEMVFDYSFGKGTLNHETVYWPGSADAVKNNISQLHDKWRAVLESMPDEELISNARTKWPFDDKPFYELAAWLNLELIKNTSEIGYCRFLYASGIH